MSGRDVVIKRLLCNGGRHAACRPFTSIARYGTQSSPERQKTIKIDGRNRLSNYWSPTSLPSKQDESHSNQDLLIRAGIIQQAHAGIFHLLPLGLRIQDKLERIIDRHMTGLGACKVSLSSISAERLWQQSGRGRDDEFFKLQDRKGTKYLLSPTHEEEITTLVAANVTSYKDLPLRLYQISRKYRDEARPRQGLLRAREFLMKDLYTFDSSEQAAKGTYDQVRGAYRALFEDLGLPFVEATASSGNMGGSLSHEYHLTSDLGEDTIIRCTNCGIAWNEEVFVPAAYTGSVSDQPDTAATWVMSKDHQKIYKIITPKAASEVNMHLIKTILPELDTGIENPLALWNKIKQQQIDGSGTTLLNDQSIAKLGTEPSLAEQDVEVLVDPRCAAPTAVTTVLDNHGHILTRPQTGDTCPSCRQPELKIGPATEVGHTFHLGSRYSKPFDAKVNDERGQQVLLQMGCHGIGVSRLIAATSGLLADGRGLNWPLSIAPFSALIAALPSTDLDGQVESVYDMLSTKVQQGNKPFDIVIDDRQKTLGYRLKDADVVGYPFIIVLGRHFMSKKIVELQCRRLGTKEEIEVDRLAEVVQGYISQLEAL